MITISYRQLKMAAVFFAAAPILIFFFTWLNLFAALGFSALLIAAAYFSFCKNSARDGERSEMQLSVGTIVGIAFISLFWCFLAGQGAFVHQTNDHMIRNMIITDLTLKEWPVTYFGGDTMLCYYIAYWMLPCAVGKLVLLGGNADLALHVSNYMLFLQSAVGIFITLLLVVMLTQKKGRSYPILAVLIFVFFSGLDIAGMMVTVPEYRDAYMRQDHIEWWALDFQYSSNTTCLYWVYNQTVPVWPLVLCLINECHLKDFAFLAVLIFPFAPFPFVGLVLFCLMRAAILLIGAVRKKTLAEELRIMLSPQNFLICFAVAPVFILYFTANVMVASSAGADSFMGYGTGFRILDKIHYDLLGDDPVARRWLIWLYFAFIFLEMGVYSILLLIHFKKGRERALIVGNMIALAVIPLFQLGVSYDFCMRVSIPGLVFICVMMIRLVIEEIPKKGEINSLDAFARKKLLLLISSMVLAIGSATPFMEITREIMNTYQDIHPDPEIFVEFSKYDYENPTSLETLSPDSNFFAQNYKESGFYRYFCKKQQDRDITEIFTEVEQ